MSDFNASTDLQTETLLSKERLLKRLVVNEVVRYNQQTEEEPTVHG